MKNLNTVVAALKERGLLVRAPASLPDLTGVTADTRRLTRGMLYCAVRGAIQDGHAYVSRAAQAGAAAALVEAEQSDAGGIPQVVVTDGRRAAALAAEVWFDHPARHLALVGVTGTNGKTTSVTLGRHVLSLLWPTGSIGTLGAFGPPPDNQPVESEAGNLTTPGPIDLQETLAALLAHGARGVTMEVSSHSLDQGRVDGLAYRAAIFTNLTRDHLDYHKTFEHYFHAKAKLTSYLTPDGIQVVNAEDPAWDALPKGHRQITFGESKGDVRAEAVTTDGTGSRFTLIAPQGRADVKLPLLGQFNIANALGVAAAALGLGAPLDGVAERLTHAPQVPGRMERIASKPCVVLRDYAHTPDALERALETVRPLTPGKVIAVFGAGGDRDRGKRAPMGDIASRLADLAIATSDNPRTEDPERILDDVEQGMQGRPHRREVDRRKAIALALSLAQAKDTVILAGKGHETYQVVGTVKEPFDERQVVRELGAS